MLDAVNASGSFVDLGCANGYLLVAPGGRLIVGAYGSRSRGLAPFDVAAVMRDLGWPVAGCTSDPTPAIV